jgi:hypothetical protein
MASSTPQFASFDDDNTSDDTRVDHHQSIVHDRAPTFDGADIVNLPTRTVTRDARLEEYTSETREGQILREIKSNITGQLERYELVTWKINDPENPKNWSKAYKWWCTMCVALVCFVVAFNSAVITANIGGVVEEFDVSRTVALLSITLFVVGFGIGKSHLRAPFFTAC